MNQENFIINKIISEDFCNVNIEKYTKLPLDKQVDMKSVLCFFNSMLLSSSPTKKFGLKKPSMELIKMIQKIKKISLKSVEASVYIADIFNLQIVIKTPKKTDKNSINSALREYLISVNCINSLHCKIPTFVYTFCAFTCSYPNKDEKKLNLKKLCKDKKDDTVYIINEKIDGETMHKLLKKNNLDFDQWLILFMQILLSLEVAQRDFEFTHFDLHGDNIMINNKNVSYEINLGDYTYIIDNPKMNPVIIDFGLSSVKIDNTTVGSFMFPEYGMLNFMVPGYDMFKILCFCCNDVRNNHEMLDNMIEIFEFYGADDPYNIYTDGMKGIDKCLGKYCKLGTYSKLATYTPLMMFDFITKKYSKITQHIYKKPRDTYYKCCFPTYNFSSNDYVKDTINCMKNKPSYIINLYNIKLLERINEKVPDKTLLNTINHLQNMLKTNDYFIEIDKKRLDKVFNIKIPTQELLDEYTDKIINIDIFHNNPKNKIDTYNNLIETISYETKLEPYLQFYYTIKEIKLTCIFDEWVRNFENSLIWNLYTKNINKTQRAKRWGITLMKSIGQ